MIQIEDWNGNSICVGDTVLYTAGGKTRGLSIGTVEKIDTKAYPQHHYKWLPDDFRYEVTTEMVIRHRVRVKGKPVGTDWLPTSHTLIEDLHPVAYSSLTRFDPSAM